MVNVGCEGDDGLLRVHGNDESCDVCAHRAIIAALVELTPEQRSAAMAEVHERFCSSCWRSLAAGERCHCNNDE